MQLARSKDGDSVYTEWDLKVQSGNSGLPGLNVDVDMLDPVCRTRVRSTFQ